MNSETYVCQACGIDVVRPVTKGQRPKWCPACRFKSVRGAARACPTCGISFLGHHADQAYCSPACYAETTRKPKPEKTPHPPRVRATWPSCRITPATCRSCGLLFMAHARISTCSDACARIKHRSEASDQRHRRRALGETRTGTLDWRRVRDQDGPACYLCGFDTDDGDFLRVIGSDGREAFVVGLGYPSLDHVVPLSRGGAHSMSNARLAHAYCNSIKSDSIAA